MDRPLPETLPPHWMIAATPDLFLSPRGGEVLVVEPESASWLVLGGREWDLFSALIGRSGGLQPAPGPSPSICCRPLRLSVLQEAGFLESEAFSRFILRLFRNNLVSINGKAYFEPATMWSIQSHPHYFNLHMTEACNLGCTYCRVSSPEAAQLMEPALARLIVRRVIEEMPGERLIIGFHGGEPLLNREAVLAGAEEAAKVAAACGKEVELCIQSNGTLITPELAEELKQHNITLGVSLDGPEPIHDRHRVDRLGMGSYERVAQGIRTAAAQGAPTGLLAVVHDPSEYTEVLEHHVREFKTLSPRLNFSAMEGRASESMEFPTDRGEAFGREWMGLLDYAQSYCRETGIWLDIADLNLFLFHLVSKLRPHMCYRSPCGAGNSILAFGADGSIYLCDELVGDESFRIGKIQEAGRLDELLDQSPAKSRLMEQRRVENVARCRPCPWRRFHGSGCANKSYRYFGHMEKEDPMCRFYSFILQELIWRVHREPSIVWLCNSYAKAGLGTMSLEEWLASITEGGSGSGH